MRKKSTYDIITIALLTAVTAVCSWIIIPTGTVPFSMQTFAVFVSALLLGSAKGTLTVILYLLLGIVGLPVFSSFQAGPGVLLGATGGFLTGFVFITLIGGYFAHRFSNNTIMTVTGLILGLLCCYIMGTVWFIFVYLDSTSEMSVPAVLSICVLPYVIPDLIKMYLAVIVTKKLKKVIKDR